MRNKQLNYYLRDRNDEDRWNKKSQRGQVGSTAWHAFRLSPYCYLLLFSCFFFALLRSKQLHRKVNGKTCADRLQKFTPLINRGRGPYCKIRTEFFPGHKSSEGHKSMGKNEDPYFTVRTEKARLIRYLLYLSFWRKETISSQSQLQLNDARVKCKKKAKFIGLRRQFAVGSQRRESKLQTF